MKRFLKELLPEGIIRLLALIAVAVIAFICWFVFQKAWPVLRESGINLFTQTGFDRQISDAFYAPADQPVLKFGLFGLIAGTVLSVIFALLVAGPLAVGGAVVIAELAPKKVAAAFTSMVRLLASVPSVVFGLVGLTVVVPLIESMFITVDLQIKYLEYFQITGRNLLSGAVVLSFMIVPTVLSLSVDAVRAVPVHLRETGFAFGMSRLRVIFRIVLPSARSGIMAGVILGAGRGVGEAIAISMVCGGIGFVPNPEHGFAALLTPVLPLSAAIVNKSEAMSVPAVESALYACGAVLLLLGALLSAVTRLIKHRMRRRDGYVD